MKRFPNSFVAVLLGVSIVFCFGCEEGYSNPDVPVIPANSSSSDRSNQDLAGQQDKGNAKTSSSKSEKTKMNNESPKIETATFGAGCFWCVEAVFQELNGVISVKSGYTGGHTKNPTYKEICTGATGHAEVCQIKYDANKITFPELLEVFWKTHDPTTLNRQGADSGTQYRSAIFYHSEQQKTAAEKYKKKLTDLGAFNSPIVTEITKASKFYGCEDYHDNYFKTNPNAGYCRAVIVPKMDKFRKAFADKIKRE